MGGSGGGGSTSVILENHVNYRPNISRVAALTSDDEPDFYENLVDSFNGVNKKIHEVASTPGVKQNILYVLMGKF